MEKICVRPQKFFKATEKIQASSEKLEGNFSQWMANKMKHIFAVDFSPAEKDIFLWGFEKKQRSGWRDFFGVACNNCSLDESSVH